MNLNTIDGVFNLFRIVDVIGSCSTNDHISNTEKWISNLVKKQIITKKQYMILYKMLNDKAHGKF